MGNCSNLADKQEASGETHRFPDCTPDCGCAMPRPVSLRTTTWEPCVNEFVPQDLQVRKALKRPQWARCDPWQCKAAGERDAPVHVILIDSLHLQSLPVPLPMNADFIRLFSSRRHEKVANRDGKIWKARSASSFFRPFASEKSSSWASWRCFSGVGKIAQQMERHRILLLSAASAGEICKARRALLASRTSSDTPPLIKSTQQSSPQNRPDSLPAFRPRAVPVHGPRRTTCADGPVDRRVTRITARSRSYRCRV